MCCTLSSRLWLSYPSTDWSHQQQKQQQRRNSDIRLNIHKNFTLDTCWWLFPVYFLFCLSFFPFYSSSLSSPDHIEWPWFVCVCINIHSFANQRQERWRHHDIGTVWFQRMHAIFVCAHTVKCKYMKKKKAQPHAFDYSYDYSFGCTLLTCTVDFEIWSTYFSRLRSWIKRKTFLGIEIPFAIGKSFTSATLHSTQ